MTPSSPQNHIPLSILVVGGGIGGLTTALALRHQGHKVRVLEASSWLRETGAAVIVPPNASLVLRSLGVNLEVDVKAVPFRNALDYFLKEGEVPQFGKGGSGVRMPWAEMLESRFPGSHFMAHRVDLHHGLIEKCTDPRTADLVDVKNGGEKNGTVAIGPPVEVLLKSRVVGWHKAASEGTVTLQDGRELQADLVVAADGLHSLAHVEVIGRNVPVVPSGVSTTRFVLDTKTILDDPATAPMMDDGEGCLAFFYTPSRKSVLMRYPCHSNELQNFGAYLLRENSNKTTMTSSEEVSRDSLIQELSFMGPLFQTLISKADPIIWNWQVGDRDPFPTYHRDKLVLLGDAAHPMLTLQAQGAAQAIEDGATLGVLLSNISDKGEITNRLKLYDELRVLRTSRMQLLSRLRPTKNHAFQEMPEGLLDLFAPDPVPANTIDINEFKWDHDCIDLAQRLLDQHLQTQRR